MWDILLSAREPPAHTYKHEIFIIISNKEQETTNKIFAETDTYVE